MSNSRIKISAYDGENIVDVIRAINEYNLIPYFLSFHISPNGIPFVVFKFNNYQEYLKFCELLNNVPMSEQLPAQSEDDYNKGIL